MNPTRASTWDAPALPGARRAVGRLRGRVAPAARRARDRPRHSHAALPRDRPALDRGLREAYLGRDVGEALRAAATDAEQRFAATA